MLASGAHLVEFQSSWSSFRACFRSASDSARICLFVLGTPFHRKGYVTFTLYPSCSIAGLQLSWQGARSE